MKKLSNKKIYQLTLDELDLPTHRYNGLCWAIRQTLINHGYDYVEADNIGYRIMNGKTNESIILQEFNCFFKIEKCDFQWDLTSERWFIRELILMFCIEMCE